MRIDILTIFPEMFRGPFDASIIQRAREKGIVSIHIHDIRDYTTDRHHTVDDYPYGGGAGMVMKPEPIFEAVEKIKADPDAKVVLLSPRGKVFNQETARRLAGEEHLVFLCGHYKDIDERNRSLVDLDISLGDYILSGGEPAALVVIDAIVRLLPGAISDPESANCDSFETGLLDHPHYTRPEEYRGMRVPEVLRSGNHAQIKQWRRQQALKLTQRHRPDLLDKADLSDQDAAFLKEANNK
ncbi:TPA: tRNA (guanosine(37)-N1)-methyltransferase TrmD [Candidatus Edwardsbacteria bacterium]|nr:tRNA (guanosine(37)-N1)-methyltransferase TrmD [Candidatus Edwardsbacteria bacterium]